jgi:hypothetical protein
MVRMVTGHESSPNIAWGRGGVQDRIGEVDKGRDGRRNGSKRDERRWEEVYA